MTGGLRAIAAGGHVAPAAPSILRIVEEHALAARVRATAHAIQLAEDECIGRGLDDRNDESGERVAHGDERSHERAVAAELDATRTGATTEHAIDLGERVFAHALARWSAFGERTERTAHPARIDERGCRAGGLLVRSTPNAVAALGVEDERRLEPAHETLEVAQRIEASQAVLAVDEVQPQSLSDEHEGRAFGGRARRRREWHREWSAVWRSECEHRGRRGTASIPRGAVRIKQLRTGGGEEENAPRAGKKRTNARDDRCVH